MRLDCYLYVTCPPVFVVVKNLLNMDYLMVPPLICRDSRRGIKRNESRLVKCCVQSRMGPSGDPGKYRIRRRCFPSW
jgi:hypothetical protein